jgi:hypothetical protein
VDLTGCIPVKEIIIQVGREQESAHIGGFPKWWEAWVTRGRSEKCKNVSKIRLLEGKDISFLKMTGPPQEASGEGTGRTRMANVGPFTKYSLESPKGRVSDRCGPEPWFHNVLRVRN